MIIAITVITIGNSWAYLTSSSSKATTEPITVGTLELTVNPETSSMTIKDVSSGSSGTLYQTTTNSGTSPGNLKLGFGNFQESIATDVPVTPAGKDTLLESVQVNVKLVKESDGTLVRQITQSSDNTVPIKDLEKLSVSNIVMYPDTSYKLVIYYEIPNNTDDGIQGKKLNFDITYKLTS